LELKVQRPPENEEIHRQVSVNSLARRAASSPSINATPPHGAELTWNRDRHRQQTARHCAEREEAAGEDLGAVLQVVWRREEGERWGGSRAATRWA
jgi:hypothetical protein